MIETGFAASTVREAAVMSATAEATDSVEVRQAQAVDWLLNLSAQGSVTRIDVTVEVSADDSTWYVAQTAAVSSGTATLSELEFQKAVSGATKFVVTTPAKGRFMRLKVAAGAGAVTGSLLAIGAFCRAGHGVDW